MAKLKLATAAVVVLCLSLVRDCYATPVRLGEARESSEGGQRETALLEVREGSAAASEAHVRRQQKFFGGVLGAVASALGGASSGGAPKDEAASAAKAEAARRGCCMVCPSKFVVELQMMELDEATTRKTMKNFQRWHDHHALAKTPGFGPPVTELLELPFGALAGPLSTGLAVLSTVATKPGASPTSAAPAPGSEAELPQVPAFGGQPCCSLCPMDFVSPGEDVDSFVQTAEGAGFIATLVGAASNLMSAASGPAAGASTGTMPPTCCDVCPSELYPPTNAFADVFLQLSAATSEEEGSASEARGNRFDGSQGCCRLCATKLGGGAPPFAEPGNANQNEGAAPVKVTRPPNPFNLRKDYDQSA